MPSGVNWTQSGSTLQPRLDRRRRPVIISSDGLIQGALTMSTAEALKPLPTPARLLDAVPPDTRVVFHDVTWDAYESLVDALGERENCRVAFDRR